MSLRVLDASIALWSWNMSLTLANADLALLRRNASLVLDAGIRCDAILMSDACLRCNAPLGLLYVIGRGRWKPRVCRMRRNLISQNVGLLRLAFLVCHGACWDSHSLSKMQVCWDLHSLRSMFETQLSVSVWYRSCIPWYNKKKISKFSYIKIVRAL